MTLEFMDVDFFIREASNRTQREFELDFADIIEVYDTNSITLTTEDRRELIISWCEKGYFKSYFVQEETTLMRSHPGMVEEIIEMLKYIDVDGETLQYIIEKVGMTDQMLRQLVMNNPYTDTSDLLEEKVRLSDQHLRSLAKNN